MAGNYSCNDIAEPGLSKDRSVRRGSKGMSVVTIVGAASILFMSIGTVFRGIAAMRVAAAWKIWASRCDPMNPNFRPPLIWWKP
jgi:hypothetical protein